MSQKVVLDKIENKMAVSMVTELKLKKMKDNVNSDGTPYKVLYLDLQCLQIPFFQCLVRDKKIFIV